jgi:hypothetical protein
MELNSIIKWYNNDIVDNKLKIIKKDIEVKIELGQIKKPIIVIKDIDNK